MVEAPGLVAGLDDLAVMGEAVEQGGGHFGVTEDGGPFAEGEVCCDDDRGALVEAADQVEEELVARLCEGQIAQFVENDEVHAAQKICHPALFAAAGLGLQPVHQIDDIEEATRRPFRMSARTMAMPRPTPGPAPVVMSGELDVGAAG